MEILPTQVAAPLPARACKKFSFSSRPTLPSEDEKMKYNSYLKWFCVHYWVKGSTSIRRQSSAYWSALVYSLFCFYLKPLSKTQHFCKPTKLTPKVTFTTVCFLLCIQSTLKAYFTAPKAGPEFSRTQEHQIFSTPTET